MKLVLVVIEKERQDDVGRVLEQSAISGYSVFPSVFGRGESGSHFGNRIFPGENVMFMALVSRPQVEGVVAALRTFGSGLRSEEAFKVIALDADVVI